MNIVYDAVGYFSVRGLLMGAGLGALYGTLVFPVLGTLLGAFFGSIVGYIGGSGCGLLAAIVTRWLFYPLTNLTIYRWVLGVGCAGVALAIAYIGFGALIKSNDFLSSIFPSVIAAGAAIRVSSGFAARYSGEKSKRKPHDAWSYKGLVW
jgi:hypothetical protein